MSQDLISVLERAQRPRILVVGDVILDRYVWGNVDRISPEAPIPLLRVDRHEQRLGGAGSVVSMLAALDCDVRLAAIVGTDEHATRIGELLAAAQVDATAILPDPGRPTTVKERFLGRAQSRHPQQIIRIDYEADHPLSHDLREALFARIVAQLDQVELVLVSDYNKGVCSGDMVPRIVAEARRRGLAVVADPIRGGDYRRYAGCACITPNRLEASLATGRTIGTPEEGLAAAAALLDFGVESAIVTLDRDGMAWATRTGERGLAPCRPREVYDITGAGDMVLSVIGFCLSFGLPHAQVVELANLAGGLEVERLGVVPLSREDLMRELRGGDYPGRRKIVSLEELLPQLSRRKQAGHRIVMTNGCFDLIHPGHVGLLREARKLGDCLVVGLNSDVSVRQLKGSHRPIIDERGRAEMLAALETVDFVVLFDEVSVEPLIGRILPDVLVKAAQYELAEVVGHELVQAHGGQVIRVPMQGDYSTSGLIERILEKPGTTAGRAS
ncbi:MAG: bifunctional heptose 7-phosphate kinase/heptose 1-phosphate adenyltransferase [Pirellulales bacterium]|nr:bifunctional heptose 7-phosphate kinase/heptose 1-phosphate adenyltransferase [Pirellulales bacterium]